MILAYVLSCLLLAAAFLALRVWPQTRAMAGGLRANFAVIGDKSLSDDAKERALRTGSIAMLRATVKLTAALAATFAAAALPVWLGEKLGALSWQGFLWFSLEPLVIVLTIAGFWALGHAGRLVRRSA